MVPLAKEAVLHLKYNKTVTSPVWDYFTSLDSLGLPLYLILILYVWAYAHLGLKDRYRYMYMRLLQCRQL